MNELYKSYEDAMLWTFLNAVLHEELCQRIATEDNGCLGHEASSQGSSCTCLMWI